VRARQRKRSALSLQSRLPPKQLLLPPSPSTITLHPPPHPTSPFCTPIEGITLKKGDDSSPQPSNHPRVRPADPISFVHLHIHSGLPTLSFTLARSTTSILTFFTRPTIPPSIPTQFYSLLPFLCLLSNDDTTRNRRSENCATG